MRASKISVKILAGGGYRDTCGMEIVDPGASYEVGLGKDRLGVVVFGRSVVCEAIPLLFGELSRGVVAGSVGVNGEDVVRESVGVVGENVEGDERVDDIGEDPSGGLADRGEIDCAVDEPAHG